MKNRIIFSTLLALSFATSSIKAEEYKIDTSGAHATIQFKIKHLGFSWLLGRFNRFDGQFNYDKNNPKNSKVEITIDTASIDSNHAERDKHLRSKDFLHVKKYPIANFVSTSFQEKNNGKAELQGRLSLHGVTKSITIDLEHIGHGADPWGGYRRGFAGSTVLTLKDFNIPMDLGPASRQVKMFLSIEGIRTN